MNWPIKAGHPRAVSIQAERGTGCRNLLRGVAEERDPLTTLLQDRIARRGQENQGTSHQFHGTPNGTPKILITKIGQMNWGNKLLVTFLAFGAGMSFLVYKSITTNYDRKDYYKNELCYQEVIDATQRANTLSDARVSSTEGWNRISEAAEGEMWSKTSHRLILTCTAPQCPARPSRRSPDRCIGTSAGWTKDVAAAPTLQTNQPRADGVDYYAEKPITVQ